MASYKYVWFLCFYILVKNLKIEFKYLITDYPNTMALAYMFAMIDSFVQTYSLFDGSRLKE